MDATPIGASSANISVSLNAQVSSEEESFRIYFQLLAIADTAARERGIYCAVTPTCPFIKIKELSSVTSGAVTLWKWEGST